MDEQIIDESNDPTTKSKTIPSYCKICGAPALYKYFGIISCHACKIFFKRNAQTGLKAFKCNSDGNCEINIHNRHICTLCRLTKCFTSGMQIEMIRCSRKTNTKKYSSTKQVSTNEIHRVQITNLLNIDHSELTIDQYNILLNLIECYEEYDILLDIQQFIQDQTNLPIKLRFKTTSLDTLFGSILNGIEIFFKLNNSFLSLSSDHHSSFLRYTMENAGHFTAVLVSHKIPFFHYSNLTESTENILINRDIIFIKLGIIMFIFSTINCAEYNNIDLDYLKNIQNILRIQNIYAEIAWRYLLNKYDPLQAVIYFTNFIKSLIIIHSYIMEIHQSQQHKYMIQNFIQKINQRINLSK